MSEFAAVNPAELEPISPRFFDDEVEAVARKLIGTFLFTIDNLGRYAGGKIIETEAYDQNDLAAHCYCPNGVKPSKLGAAEAMFLAGGHAYVYPTMNNCCLNFVTGPIHFGSAVLIRAILPIASIEQMIERHTQNYKSKWLKDERKRIYNLCSGPGNLCVSLNISELQNMQSLHAKPFDLRLNNQNTKIASGPRVNITNFIRKRFPKLDQNLQNHHIERHWRFADQENLNFIGDRHRNRLTPEALDTAARR